MNEPVNPLVPTAYDLVWSAIAIAALILLVIALVSIGRNRRALTSMQALVWTLLAVFVPVIGPVAWLLAGRPARLEVVAE